MVFARLVSRAIACAIVIMTWSASGAFAQTAAQDIETRVERPDALKAPIAGPSIQYTSQRPPTNADQITFVLKSLNVVGATAYPQERIEEIYAERIGAEIKLSEVYEIAADIQRLYRGDDFIFTRVIVPAQQIDGGLVRLDVIEATIEQAVVEEPAEPIGPVKALAERIIAPLVGQLNPTGKELERILFALNAIPGVTRATAVPQAGTGGRGSLALYVNIERDPAEMVIYADNRQSTGVGQGILGIIATFNSYTSGGDTTSFALFNSLDYDSKNFDTGERSTFQIRHSRNVGSAGTQLEARALYSRTRPGDELAATGIEGTQVLFGVKATHPLVSSRKLVMKGRAELEINNSTTDVSNGALRVAEDRLRVATVALEGISRDSAGYTAFDIALRHGLDIYDANRASDQLSRNDGVPDFALIRGTLERQVIFNEDLSALLKFSGQYSFDPLLASEEFSIGGTTFGRGFDPSQFTGDHGFGFAGELKYFRSFTVMEERVAIEPYMFGEMGFVYNIGDGLPSRQGLASFGGGIRFFLPEDLAIGIEYAFPAVRFDPDQLIEEKTSGLFFNLTKRL